MKMFFYKRKCLITDAFGDSGKYKCNKWFRKCWSDMSAENESCPCLTLFIQHYELTAVTLVFCAFRNIAYGSVHRLTSKSVLVDRVTIKNMLDFKLMSLKHHSREMQ